MADHSGRPAPPPRTEPRPAQRLERRRWSDPRLAVGIALVAGSVVAGAAVIEATDDTTSVWALRVDVRAGQAPDLADLERVDVHLGRSVAAQYLSGSEDVVRERLDASTWARDLAAGELLARSALAGRDEVRAGELPLSVPPGSMPADLRAGQRVDVWAGPGRGNGDLAEAERVLEGVQVAAVRERSAALGEGATRTVLIAVDEQRADDLGDVLARTAEGTVTLVRVGQEEAP